MSDLETDPVDLDPGSEVYRARLDSLFRYAQVGHSVNGVAHDINNLLGAASAYAELVALDKSLGPEPKRMLGEVVNSAQRCSKLVSALTGVARRDTVNPSVVEPRNILESLELLVGYTVRAAKVAFATHADENLPSMWCDAPKVQHALIYLVYNALESVSETEKASVCVSVSGAENRMVYTVTDTGKEISDSVRARMFEDGFTTKQEGAHLGLGLGRARRIAELHGGTLDYSPATGFNLAIDPARLASG